MQYAYGKKKESYIKDECQQYVLDNMLFTWQE